MKKYLLLISLILIFGIALLTQQAENTLGMAKPNQSPLDEILEISGGKFYEVRIYAWGRVNGKYMTLQEMRKPLADISKTYYNTQSAPKFRIEENFKSGEIILSPSPTKSLRACLQTYRPPVSTPDLPTESYLMVEMAQSDANFTLLELKNQILAIYHKLAVTPKLTLTYTAKLRGKINPGEVNNIFTKTKAILALNNIQEVKNTGFNSLVGYSEHFPDEIIIAGTKQNFTLTTRYNIADDETYIIFGTPDLGGEE